jgi:hypothetical protein
VRFAAVVFGLTVITYVYALAIIIESPSMPLALPEPVTLLLGGVIGVVLLLVLPEWW